LLLFSAPLRDFLCRVKMELMIFFAVVLSYFCGAIPFGVLVGKARGVDVRAVGSGNIGTTNVWRALGPVAGTIVFALDVLKGLAGPLIGKSLLSGNEWGIALCAVAAVLGHVFSCFLAFKGGKGIATALGAIFGLAPLVALGAFALWGIVLGISRFISVASIVACVAVIIGAWATQVPVPSALVMTVMGVLAFLKHIPNMKRLAAGTEPRVGEKKPVETTPIAAQTPSEVVR
jgi:glycerol-3-phosphate acyltransferase PlsY